MELEQIVARFVADVQGYEAGMKKVEQSTRQAVARSSAEWNKLASTIKGAIGGLVGALSLQQLYRATQATLEWADNIKTLAERLNVSTDALQELIYAGREVNIGAAEMTAGMQHFATAVAEAATGRGRGIQAFKALGLDINDAKKDLGELFDLFAARIGEFDRPSQLAIAKSFFGGDALKFLDLLGKGPAELARLRQAAREAGVVLSSDLINRGEELNKQIERLTDQVQSKLREAFINLGPVLVSILGLVARIAGAVKQMIDDTNSGMAEARRLANMTPAQRQDEYRRALGMPTTENTQPTGEVRRVEQFPPRLHGEMKYPGQIPRPPRGPDIVEKRTGTRTANLGRDADALNQFEQKIKELQAEGRALQVELKFDRPYAEFQKMVDLFQLGTDKIKPLPDQVRRFREEASKVYSDKILIQIRDYQRATEEILRLTEAEATGNSETVRIMKEKIDLERQLGAEYARTHPKLIEQMARERVEAEKTLERTKERIDNIKSGLTEVGQAFTSAFSEAILNGSKFSDVLKALERDLLRIAMNRLIMEPLFGGKEGGLFGGLVSKAIGFLGLGSERGNVFMGPVRPHDKGGVMSGPFAFPMGDGRLGTGAEKRPEAIFPIIRTSTGELGVRAVGAAGSSERAGNLSIRVINNTEAKASAEVGPNGDITIFLDQAMEQLVNRSGSRTNRALRQRFVATPRTITR